MSWIGSEQGEPDHNNTCGFYTPTTSTLTFADSNVYYVQNFSSEGCGPAEVSGTLTHEQ